MVVVLGARQTGKTTLIRSLPQLAQRPYLTLDDFDLRAQAAADPEAVVDRAPKLVIDEVQRARDVLIAVKRAVDRDPRRSPGRFVLTGSANLLMMEQIGETLAGRALYVTLWPFTRFQAIRLPAYSVNRTKRLIKAPKLYWCDTALALHLAGESEPRGPHLENLVLMDLLAWRNTQARRPEVLYWRTASGEEVDFVIETATRTIPIEVKAATRLAPADARGLESFLDEYASSSDGALLLYGGTETFPLTRRVLAVPWWRIC